MARPGAHQPTCAAQAGRLYVLRLYSPWPYLLWLYLVLLCVSWPYLLWPTCATCAEGYFMQGTTCVACSTSECGTGFYRGTCLSSSDAVCSGCTTKPLNSNYATSGQPFDADSCGWTCEAGYWQSGESCTSCTTSACTAGEYRGTCGTDVDASCISCDASQLPRYSHFIGSTDVQRRQRMRHCARDDAAG